MGKRYRKVTIGAFTTSPCCPNSPKPRKHLAKSYYLLILPLVFECNSRMELRRFEGDQT